MYTYSKLLLVDDDADFAAAQAEFLESNGYQVALAGDIGEAEQAATDFAPHLALIDLRLGHGNGLELLGKFRDAYPDLVCIMMTGYAELDTAVEALRRGAVDYLRKPVEPGELLRVLERNLERKRLLDELKISQERLNQASKMEALGTLAGGVAHDFNNILAAISGFAELVRREVSKDTAAHEYTSQILTASQRATDLVQQILTFARQAEESREVIDLEEVSRDALKLLRPTLPASLEIHTDYQGRKKTVQADRTQMHQVLMNLCNNAVQAIGPGRGNIWIGIEEYENQRTRQVGGDKLAPGHYLKLSVRDDGGGLQPHIEQRVFEPFFTTREVGQGTGMGLAVVHSIVTNTGGAIEVNSNYGVGTTFSIYLPRAEGAVGATPVEEFSLRQHGGRLLAVDDEQMILKFYEAVLQREGYELVACTNGQQALEVFQADPDGFDLVITDETMPMMNGSLLALEIKKIREEQPVVLCSGAPLAVSEEARNELPIDGYLLKPVSVDLLLDEVGRIVNSPRRNRSKAESSSDA